MCRKPHMCRKMLICAQNTHFGTFRPNFGLKTVYLSKRDKSMCQNDFVRHIFGTYVPKTITIAHMCRKLCEGTLRFFMCPDGTLRIFLSAHVPCELSHFGTCAGTCANTVLFTTPLLVSSGCFIYFTVSSDVVL